MLSLALFPSVSDNSPRDLLHSASSKDRPAQKRFDAVLQLSAPGMQLYVE
jgi:hypothetical protein